MEKTHFSSEDCSHLLDRWPFELKSKKIKLYFSYTVSYEEDITGQAKI